MIDVEDALEDRYLRVTMPDGSRWDVPVLVIAWDRAAWYVGGFGNNVVTSLRLDTGPLFLADGRAIEDWAANEMKWSHVAHHAVRVVAPDPGPPDYEEGWTYGDKEVVTVYRDRRRPTRGRAAGEGRMMIEEDDLPEMMRRLGAMADPLRYLMNDKEAIRWALDEIEHCRGMIDDLTARCTAHEAARGRCGDGPGVERLRRQVVTLGDLVEMQCRQLTAWKAEVDRFKAEAADRPISGPAAGRG